MESTDISIDAFAPIVGRQYAIGAGTKKRLVVEWVESIEYGTWCYRLAGSNQWYRLDEAPGDWSICEVDQLGRQTLAAHPRMRGVTS